MNDPKLDFPSVQRNIEPIVKLLKRLLKTPSLKWLEIGSGSGQHIERFGREFPDYEFQPTDIEEANLNSITAWVSEAGLTNVLAPCALDVTQNPWPFDTDDRFDIISAFNVIHITPWNVTRELFKGASTHGSAKCRIFLYGPFRIDGEHTSESNARFEEWLEEKSDAFGIRDIDDVNQVALDNAFELSARHLMPANNFMMEFTRTEY